MFICDTIHSISPRWIIINELWPDPKLTCTYICRTVHRVQIGSVAEQLMTRCRWRQTAAAAAADTTATCWTTHSSSVLSTVEVTRWPCRPCRPSATSWHTAISVDFDEWCMRDSVSFYRSMTLTWSVQYSQKNLHYWSNSWTKHRQIDTKRKRFSIWNWSNYSVI
jgi:hypothetical protein